MAFPQALPTVAVYTPALLAVIDVLPEPVLQVYVPLLPLRVSVALCPEQITLCVELIDSVGVLLTVTVAEALAEPQVFETLTVLTPALFTEIELVFAEVDQV